MKDLEFFDWVKRKTLAALFSSARFRDSLVLKGGNLLDIAYEVSTRASVDLDFSIEGEFQNIETVRAECEAVLSAKFEGEGYKVLDVTFEERPAKVSEDLKDFWGGYQVHFKLIKAATFQRHKGDPASLTRNAVPLGIDGSTSFKIDISKFEYCAEKRELTIDGQKYFGYSPEMSIAEKLRAICQQMPEYLRVVHRPRIAGRARDFVDIHSLQEAFRVNFENPTFHELVAKIFERKHVPVHLIDQIAERSEDHRPDFTAVRDTVRNDAELQDFDFYVDYIARECRSLEPLWNKKPPA